MDKLTRECRALIDAAASTPAGAIMVELVVADVASVVEDLTKVETMAGAVAKLQKWSQDAEPLRKGLSSALLERAKAMVGNIKPPKRFGVSAPAAPNDDDHGDHVPARTAARMAAMAAAHAGKKRRTAV